MKKIEVLTSGKFYTVLRRDATFQPYIVAYDFDADDQTWVNGHYFDDYEKALMFFFDSEPCCCQCCVGERGWCEHKMNKNRYPRELGGADLCKLPENPQDKHRYFDSYTMLNEPERVVNHENA